MKEFTITGGNLDLENDIDQGRHQKLKLKKGKEVTRNPEKSLKKRVKLKTLIRFLEIKGKIIMKMKKG